MNEQAKFFWENRPTLATQALHDVMAERHRQMMVEGWTAKHDDEHSNGSMAYAAAAYAVSSTEGNSSLSLASKLFCHTGWAKRWWKPRTPREDLVRATALLLAEIERRDRAASKARVTNGRHGCERCDGEPECTCGVAVPRDETFPPSDADGGGKP